VLNDLRADDYKKKLENLNRLQNFIYRTLRPEMYHGHGKRPPFFEGWYYKLVSADESQRYAVIPGVQLGEDGHAFVQVLDGVNLKANYYRFPLEVFWASSQEFEVRIADNRFTLDEIELNINGKEGQLEGKLKFEHIVGWPVSWRSPGIMGWYAWAPFMETYHGVLSFDHTILGGLEIDGKVIDFQSGRGYIEKDWGKSFPQAWIWFQSNHFESPGISLTASAAIIPWLRSSFRGFIVGLWLDGELYRFATYTGAKIEALSVADDRAEMVISDANYLLEMTAVRERGGLLRGPTQVDMGLRVAETLGADVLVRLREKSGKEVFSGRGRHGGLEIQGDIARLLAYS
jgi:tocopherol cyclase